MHKRLIHNKNISENHTKKSSNLLFRTTEPALDAGFSVFKSIGDTLGDTLMRKTKPYRDVKLNTTGPKWFVEFKYMIPLELRHLYGNRRWKRFKKYKGINVVKSVEYGESLRLSVELALYKGYNPFVAEKDSIEIQVRGTKKKEWTVQQAFLFFKQKWMERDLSEAADDKYGRIITRFIDWLGDKQLPAAQLIDDHIEAFLSHLKKKYELGNRSYNSDRGFLATILNFLRSKKIIGEIKLPPKLKTKSTKHRYYDDATLKKVKEVLSKKDPYVNFAFDCVYYLCLRSEEELKTLRVKHIIPERKQVFVAEGKTGERYVPMCEEVLQLFKQRGILNYPKDHFVFSVPSKNKYVRDGNPGTEPFGRGFFSKRFSKRRKEIGITKDFTIYGAKHTRVIHLKNDGARDVDIMALTGHESYEAFATYLKDLGLTANVQDIHLLTRKI